MVIGDIQDVLGVVEGGAEAVCPLLQVSPPLKRDPVSLLHQQRHPWEDPGFQVPQLVGFVETEEIEAVVMGDAIHPSVENKRTTLIWLRFLARFYLTNLTLLHHPLVVDRARTCCSSPSQPISPPVWCTMPFTASLLPHVTIGCNVYYYSLHP